MSDAGSVSDAGFDDVRFPLAIGPGASLGAEWRTDVVALANGNEIRNGRWSLPRRRWDVASAVVSLVDLRVLTDFFDARLGRLRGFRFRDPTHNSSALPEQPVSAFDQPLGVGDGLTRAFQLCRDNGGQKWAVKKPVPGTVLIGVDGIETVSGWTVDTASGIVTFDQAPESEKTVTAGFYFDWPVRFDTDRLDVTLETMGAGRAVSIPILELR